MWLIVHVELTVRLKLGVSAFCNSVLGSTILSFLSPCICDYYWYFIINGGIQYTLCLFLKRNITLVTQSLQMK